MANTTNNTVKLKKNMISISFQTRRMINTKYKMIKKMNPTNRKYRIMMKMQRMLILTITKGSMLMTTLVKSINVLIQEHILNQRIYAGEFILLLIRGSLLKLSYMVKLCWEILLDHLFWLTLHMPSKRFWILRSQLDITSRHQTKEETQLHQTPELDPWSKKWLVDYSKIKTQIMNMTMIIKRTLNQ
jgi:hypothetical protein